LWQWVLGKLRAGVDRILIAVTAGVLVGPVPSRSLRQENLLLLQGCNQTEPST
jgi:hypothetical protein